MDNIKMVNNTNAILHPAVEGFNISAEYRIWLDGDEAPVHSIIGFAGGSAAFLSFDMTGPVEVKIWADRNFETASIRPLSAGIECARDENTITFILDKPRNLFVKWDDGFELPVYIWASAPDTDVPDPNDENVIYYGAGSHDVGRITMESNQHLYIAPGAIVYGCIKVDDAENIKISGRGILCGSKDGWPSQENPEHDLVGIWNCKNVDYEGVILLDSWGWTLVFHNCENVHVDGARLLTERLKSTDGINPCNSRNVLIENCFARTKDDCVSIKGLDYHGTEIPPDISLWTPIQNIEIRNCVFWSDNNNAIVVGTETRAEVIENIKFSNIDIVKASNTCGDVAGAMAVLSLHDTVLQNIVFENIRIEYATGPWLIIFFLKEIFGIPSIRRPEGGVIQDVRFKNINITGGPHRPAYIHGEDENHVVKDIEIENLYVHGKQITNSKDARIVIGEYVENFKLL
ncbi:MAG: glycosyl hydrolase family 28 protein [Kiritimatiellae bacterium]|jgi:hypothetical protein|nr:glycosyl hydrolase family 28 protein [Kiritimatiellia bacterium]